MLREVVLQGKEMGGGGGGEGRRGRRGEGREVVGGECVCARVCVWV